MQGISRHGRGDQGFTLIEVMMGAAVLAVVLVALIGSLVGQQVLRQHARNLTLAMNDATRVMEEIRKQNTGANGTCAVGVPSVKPPGNFTSWDAWLAAPRAMNGGGGKTVETIDSTRYELVAVTCQGDADQNGSFETYCSTAGPAAQIGTGEWKAPGAVPGLDPIRVTVSVGWMQSGRVVGGTSQGDEFAIWGSGQTKRLMIAGLSEYFSSSTPDVNNNGVIDSQAMLTTFVTCR